MEQSMQLESRERERERMIKKEKGGVVYKDNTKRGHNSRGKD